MASEEVYLKVGVDDAGEIVVEEIDKTTCIAEATAVKGTEKLQFNRNCLGYSYTDKDSVTTDDGYLKYYVQAHNLQLIVMNTFCQRGMNGLLSRKIEILMFFGLGHSHSFSDQTDSDILPLQM